MNYLITYEDGTKDIHKRVMNSICSSLVQVKANLLAYRESGRVLEVKLYELDYFILRAIRKKDINIFLDQLTTYCKGKFTMEQLEPLAKEQCIKYEVAPISAACEYDCEMWYILNEYIVSFSGLYNQYGVLELKNITIYDSTDSVILQKNID